MTIFVDDMRCPARVGVIEGRWSHLMSDAPAGESAELMEFAHRLGMRPEWVQYRGTIKEHYDLTDPKRLLALRMGARSIRYGHEGAALMAAKRAGVHFDLDAHRNEHPDENAGMGQLDLF